MKTSVVITSYNHEAFVGEAIESVLIQTEIPDEIIVIDDSSTDESVKVIREFSKHIRLIRNSQNLGGANTTSLGVKAASGDYVAVLNSDDKWERTKLQKQHLYMSENDLDCSFTTANVIDDFSRIVLFPPREFDVFKRTFPINGSYLYHLINYGNFLCHSSVMAKRDLFIRTDLYDIRLKQLPDYSKWLDFARAGRIGIVPENLTLYRFLGSNNTSSVESEEVATLTRFEYLLIFRDFFSGLNDETLFETFVQLLPDDQPQTRVEALSKILLSIENSPLREIGRITAINLLLEGYDPKANYPFLKELIDSVIR